MIPELHKQYGVDIEITMMHEEGLFTLVSNRDDLSVRDVIDAFKLDPLDAYLARCAKLQDALRSGEELPDLTPPYLGRAQWM